MTNFIIFFVVVFAVIILGSKTKINMGIWAYLAALLLGFFFCNMSISKVIGNIPTGNLYIFMMAGMFYSFATHNGAMKLLARKLVYKFRNQKWMGPFLMFIVAAIISLSGCNGSTSLILSGLTYAMASAMGINPLPCLVAVFAAASGLGMFPWTTAGSNNYSIMSGQVDADLAFAGCIDGGLISCIAILLVVVFLTIFTGKKGAKNTSTDIDLNAVPEPFNKDQKITLTIIFVSLLLIIVPTVLKTVLPTPFTKKLANFLGIQIVWTVGVIVQGLLKLGDLKEVITKKMPWNSIILITGMGTLFSLAQSMGVVKILGDFVSSVSAVMILPCMAAICAIMSFFVSGSVITPFFAPLVMTIATASGINPVMIMAAIHCGASMSACSPFSTGGVYLLSGCQDEETRQNCTNGLLKVAVFNVVLSFVVWVIIAVIIVH